ncbi:MAG: methyltransferase domain-containing protein [Hydrococcus sp. RU_2_2]|nr:methyltransferase domain-containing protein [Hydrococcus sp. RU_2_2]
MNRNSSLYRTLRWMYQPIKASKKLYQEITYIPRRQAILARHQGDRSFVGLQIGCGSFHLPEWINTDMQGTPDIDFPIDITRKLPLPDNFLDAMYGSEVIEHIELTQARLFLAEALRILKPGGVIRLTTPDLSNVCRVFLGLKEKVNVEEFREVWLDGEFSKEIWINSQFRAWGHQHLWTYESFADELSKAGFCHIQRCEPLQTKSNKPQLENIDYRWQGKTLPFEFACALIVEASKPG